jgi:cation:H+ antiporter
MDILVHLIKLAVGFALLAYGANWLISGGASLALRFGISSTVVGLTIVSYGTSLPEFTVSLTSALSGSSPLAMGNIIGSNIANIGLILGIASLIRPISVNIELIKRDLPLLLLTTLLLVAFAYDGHISRLEGMIFLSIGLSYTIYLIFFKKRKIVAVQVELATSNAKNNFLIFLGMLGLMAGGSLSVNGAVFFADYFGMSQRIIGITIISIGTSLPELSASVVAAFKHNSEIALGNVIGSNLFNIAFVLGATSIINPLSFASGFQLYMDLALVGIITLLLLPIIYSSRKIIRMEGFFLLLLYTSYIIYLIIA